jgi:RNA polymerase sigma-70 factor (ECF subfamily)
LLRAWRKRSTLRDVGSRKSWLAAILRNEAFRYYSRPRPDPTDLLELYEGREDELVLSTVDRFFLQEALKGLSERERVLLALRYEEDLTQSAIAARLGIPEGTVKVQLHRARVKLRRAYAA